MYAVDGPHCDGAPIFIGGEHRSGTTLLAAILDSHPQLVFGLELDFLEPVNLGPHLLECCELLNEGKQACLARGTQLTQYHWGVQFVRQCAGFGVGLAALAALVRDTMAARGSDLTEFRDRCALVGAIGERRRQEAGARGWGIKLQRDIVLARTLAESWPRARFVHIVRDGRDVAASHVRDHSSWGYRNVTAAAAGWSALVEATRPFGGWEQFHEIRYEDLIRDPRTTLVGLTQFLGLPWEEAALSHTRSRHSFLAGGGYDHPSAAAVQEPINARALARYRNDLSPAEVRTVETIAGPWLTALGYPIDA